MDITPLLGWIPDLPDIRDFTARVSEDDISQITSMPLVDLRPGMPSVYDQKSLGACTASAIAGAIEYLLLKQGEDFMPSRLFIYFNERDIEGSVQWDSGAQIRDGIKSINALGVCPETEWPYIISAFTTRPNDQCYTDAKLHTALQYESIPQDIIQMKACLAAGYPIVGGFSVYESFQHIGNDGMVPMPQPSERLLGGHAVLIVGYDDTQQVWVVRNSWNTTWGDKGYCYFPYQYWLSPGLSDDLWSIKIIK